jgi:hypothetical protein
MGEPSSFIISELTGERNKLELVGRALPYRGFKLEGSMRAEFVHYPGNPIATVQILGPQEGTTSINGLWKSRFIQTTTDPIETPFGTIPGLPVIGQTGRAHYDGVLVSNISDLVRYADGFRRRGSLLEVSWNDIVRQGVMTKFMQNWLRAEDVEWEMEFTWMSQAEDELPIAFSLLGLVTDLANAIIDTVNSLVETIAELKDAFAAVTSWINAVNNIIDAITAAASGLVDLVKQAVNVVVAPFAVVGNMIAACQTIKDNCTELLKTLESLPARIVRAVGIDPNTETQDQTLGAERIIRKAKRAARKARAAAAQQQQQLIAQSQDQTAPLATFVARDGMDLRDVSTKYYNTPDEWIRLKLYNGFNTSRLIVGDTVIVPRLNTLNTKPSASTLKVA